MQRACSEIQVNMFGGNSISERRMSVRQQSMRTIKLEAPPDGHGSILFRTCLKIVSSPPLLWQPHNHGKTYLLKTELAFLAPGQSGLGSTGAMVDVGAQQHIATPPLTDPGAEIAARGQTHSFLWLTNWLLTVLDQTPAGKLHENHSIFSWKSGENFSQQMFYSLNLAPWFPLVISVVTGFDFCTFAIRSSTCLFCLCYSEPLHLLLATFICSGRMVLNFMWRVFLLPDQISETFGERRKKSKISNWRGEATQRKPLHDMQLVWSDFLFLGICCELADCWYECS